MYIKVRRGKPYSGNTPVSLSSSVWGSEDSLAFHTRPRSRQRCLRTKWEVWSIHRHIQRNRLERAGHRPTLATLECHSLEGSRGRAWSVLVQVTPDDRWHVAAHLGGA